MSKDNLILRLYCRFKDELRQYAIRCGEEVHAEDIVHQSFINGYNKLSEQHTLQEQRAYLYTTVRNLCHNARRNRHIEYSDTACNLAAQITVVDTHDYLYKIIEQLPRREGEVLLLALQGYSSQEIAQRLHIGYTTVKHYKKEAYAKIRILLKDESDDLLEA